MDSKAHPNECENETEQHTGCSENGLLNRRKYLMLSAAAVGAVGAGSGAATASSGAAERNGITFDRVVDATADLGIDEGDRVDDALGNVADEGDTLVQFPPGEYLVGGKIDVDGDNFGIESTTGDREDVVFRPVKGRVPTMFRPGGNPSGFYVGHVTFDRRDEWDSSLSLMRGNFADAVYVTDIEITGWAPEDTDSIAKFNIKDSNGTALIDGVTQHGPIQYGVYPGGTTLAFFNGQGTEGDITYRNIDLRGASESGIYAGKAYGAIRVEDSYFKNCAHSAVRVSGEGSWIKNTTIVMDIDDLHPDSEVTDPEGIELNRGIWVQSAEHEHAGPLIEDCDIIINNAGPGVGGIVNHPDSGGAEIRNTRVECNQDDIRPILIQGESTRKAGKPYVAKLDGVSVTGSGSGKPAITIRDRDGTTVKNSCIQMPNTDGIQFEGTSDATIEDTNVNVGGRATIFENADVTTTNLTSGESCPAARPDSWRNGDDSDGGDSSTDDGSTDGSDADSGNESGTTDPAPSGNRIVVAQVREGEVVRYRLTASDGLATGEYAGEEPDGNTVTGRVGSSRGVDDFYVDGYVTDFDGGSFEYANVYFADEGVDVDVDNYVLQNPEDLREVDPAVLGENVITIESDGDQATEFEFDVSGDVVPGATGNGAAVSDGTVNGSTADLAAFHFTGSVDNVAVTDPENVTVSVNGTALADGDLSTVGGAESGSESESETGRNRIVVAQVREGEVVRYRLTASDGLTSGEYAGEEPDGNTVSGRVGRSRGVDDFYVDGYVTDFDGGSFEYANVYFADEGVDVDVDNYVLQNPEDLREVDPAVLGENVITIESNDDRASGFEFDVSGDVVPGATGDGVTVADGTVNGSTADLAAFHFTGSVDNVAVTDPENVTVSVNGTALADGDLSTIGGELPHTLSLVGTGSVTSYNFTVSGEIEAESSPNGDIAGNISSSGAEGAIETGTHVYDFSGELTNLTVTGDIEVYLDGEPVDDGSSERHLIVFDGSNDDEVSSYKFAASGSVESSPEHTVAADSEWDSLESKVETDSAVGLVHKGKDAFWFSGHIEELELRGSAVATFETVE